MFCFSFDSAESAVNCRELIEAIEVVEAKSSQPRRRRYPLSYRRCLRTRQPNTASTGTVNIFSNVVFPTRLFNCGIQKSVAMSDGTLRVIHSEPGDTELRVTHKLEAKFGHFLIGRHRKADLEIDNNIISRKHVVIK